MKNILLIHFRGVRNEVHRHCVHRLIHHRLAVLPRLVVAS